MQGVPDTLTINAATSVVGADPTAAINQSSDKMNAVLGALKAKNVSSSDIATTNVTVSPQYGPDGNVVTSTGGVAGRPRQPSPAATPPVFVARLPGARRPAGW